MGTIWLILLNKNDRMQVAKFHGCSGYQVSFKGTSSKTLKYSKIRHFSLTPRSFNGLDLMGSMDEWLTGGVTDGSERSAALGPLLQHLLAQRGRPGQSQGQVQAVLGRQYSRHC